VFVIDFHLLIADWVNIRPWAVKYVVKSSGQGTEHYHRSPRSEPVAEFCPGHEALMPFADAYPFLASDPAQELERCVCDAGFRGLELHPICQGFCANDSMLHPLYAKVPELGFRS
jgi:predicted TIM-barrel fold metal-dependent hydrolase